MADTFSFDLVSDLDRQELGIPSQGLLHCSQAAQKAFQSVLPALDQDPEHTHAIERLLPALELARHIRCRDRGLQSSRFAWATLVWSGLV